MECKCSAYATLPLRLIIAILFFYHGLTKLMGMEGTIAFFGSIGFAPFFAYLVAIVEVVAAVAILIGLWTRIFSGLLAVIMIVAFFAVKLPKGGFFGGELDLALLAILISLMMNGAGKWAVWDGKCLCRMRKAPAKKRKR
ncbi:MAG: DoxX family protein [archaeon]